MKILHVQDTDWIDKGPQQQHHLLERLSNEGYKIVVIDYDVLWKMKKGLISPRISKKVPPKAIAQANIFVSRPPTIRIDVLNYVSMLITYSREIIRQIKTFKPDRIIGEGLLGAGIARIFSYIYGIRYVLLVTDKNYRAIPFKILQPLGFALEKWIYHHADSVVVINEQLKDFALRMTANPLATYVIRAGVETSLFSFNENTRKVMRKKYNIKNSDLVLFFMGWLYIFSGLKEVITRLHEINNTNIKLFVLGTGDFKTEMLEMRTQLHMEEQILYHDWIPYRELPNYESLADICLLPAHSDPLINEVVPIKLYEYLAINRPVIASKLMGVYREFKTGNGVVYIDSPEKCVERAIEIWKKNQLVKLGNQGRNFVLENCNWEKLLDAFKKVINS